MTITWKQTKLGIFYPTNNGFDISRDLTKKHGCTFTEADHPYLESKEEAIEWASTRGYGSDFDFSKTETSSVTKGLSLDDI